ncbi:MAG TPA: outer membrane beta-barrel protein [Vicinamibacterales bacterium]|nr:outer membrane beta-barrel protein [Vicinamibacterales bacterium]
MKKFAAVSVTGALALACLSVALPAAAQDVPKAEVSGGYQLLHIWGEADGESGSETLSKGWYGDVAGNLTKSLGIVFQVSGNYKTLQESVSNSGLTITATAHVRVHQFLGGMRVNARPNRTVTAFGQILLGAFNTSGTGEASVTAGGETTTATSEGESSTDFALQVGGGVNVMLSKTVGVRGGADYVRVFEKDTPFNGVRVVVGAVFAF